MVDSETLARLVLTYLWGSESLQAADSVAPLMGGWYKTWPAMHLYVDVAFEKYWFK